LEHPPKDFSETFDFYYSTSATKVLLFIDLFPATLQKSGQIAKLTLTTQRKISIFILMGLITIS